MIPIISYANLLNSLIAALLALRIERRARHTNDQGVTTIVSYFVLFYTAFSFMWLFYAGPGVFAHNALSVTLTQFSADVMAYIAVMVGLQIPFFVLNKRSIGTLLALVVASFGVVYALGRIVTFSLHEEEVVGPYIYWTPTFAPWLQALTGAATSIGSIIFSATFFWLAYRERANSAVRTRAMHLAVGMVFVLFSSSIFFIFSTGGFVAASLAAACSVAGLSIMYRGVPRLS